MSDIDEALEALNRVVFRSPISRANTEDFSIIRQTLERQREEIDALSRMNRALDQRLAEFDDETT